MVDCERETHSWKTNLSIGPACNVQPEGRCCRRGAPGGARDVPAESVLRLSPETHLDGPRPGLMKANASGDVRGVDGRARRLLGANTAQVSHGCAYASAALRLIGQSASRGPSRGTGPPEVLRLPVPGRPGPARFRLDPPGPGRSTRLCRARDASLSSGRSCSREGNP
jgi:hypothetical protein